MPPILQANRAIKEVAEIYLNGNQGSIATKALFTYFRRPCEIYTRRKSNEEATQ